MTVVGGEPPVLAPMLAGGSGMPTHPERYQFEPKLDGQRLVVRSWSGNVEARSRTGAVVTSTYPELKAMAPRMPPGGVVLDAEVVAFDRTGTPDFGLLQRRMHVREPGGALLAEVPVALVVFDILWDAGALLVDLPQVQRRARLEELGRVGVDPTGPSVSAAAVVGSGSSGPTWQIGPVLAGDPEDLLAGVRTLGLEGLMAKRLDAPYRPGQRSDAWVKVKWRREREFVVGGWSEGEGRRGGSIGSLALGFVVQGASGGDLLDRPVLRYVGQVGSGLTDAISQDLATAFARYGTSKSPFLDPPVVPRLHWVAPLLVVQVAFAEVTVAGTLRHPALVAVRADVTPLDVGWDEQLERRG